MLGDMLESLGQPVGLRHLLVFAALLFAVGLYGVLTRRNAIGILMALELMLNAVNANLIAFWRYGHDVGGQAVVFFVLVVAAAKVVVGLGIIVAILRRRQGATADDISLMRG